jgi:hypothetical protein
MRAQVGAWTLVYSRRMDSQYIGTVMVAEVVVQFRPSSPDGRTHCLQAGLWPVRLGIRRLSA